MVLITGDLALWRQTPALRVVLTELVSLHATVVFLPCSGTGPCDRRTRGPGVTLKLKNKTSLNVGACPTCSSG